MTGNSDIKCATIFSAIPVLTWKKEAAETWNGRSFYLHRKEVITCHDDYIFPGKMHDRQIHFQFQFGYVQGFQHQHDLPIHPQAQGDTFQSETRSKFKPRPQRVQWRFRQVAFSNWEDAPAESVDVSQSTSAGQMELDMIAIIPLRCRWRKPA